MKSPSQITLRLIMIRSIHVSPSRFYAMFQAQVKNLLSHVGILDDPRKQDKMTMGRCSRSSTVLRKSSSGAVAGLGVPVVGK
jgi:hypothetical protein